MIGPGTPQHIREVRSGASRFGVKHVCLPSVRFTESRSECLESKRKVFPGDHNQMPQRSSQEHLVRATATTACLRSKDFETWERSISGEATWTVRVNVSTRPCDKHPLVRFVLSFFSSLNFVAAEEGPTASVLTKPHLKPWIETQRPCVCEHDLEGAALSTAYCDSYPMMIGWPVCGASPPPPALPRNDSRSPSHRTPCGGESRRARGRGRRQTLGPSPVFVVCDGCFFVLPERSIDKDGQLTMELLQFLVEVQYCKSPRGRIGSAEKYTPQPTNCVRTCNDHDFRYTVVHESK